MSMCRRRRARRRRLVVAVRCKCRCECRCEKQDHRPPRPSVMCGNLAANGSFDEWTSAVPPQPVDWDVATNVTRAATLTHTLPFAANLGANPTAPATLGQTIEDAESGFCYRFEFQARNPETSPAVAEVLFDGVPVVTLRIPPGLSSYSYYSAFTPCLPEGASVQIQFTKPGAGVFLVDDVAFSAVGRCGR